jgi:AraC-like DNA-binding protein
LEQARHTEAQLRLAHEQTRQLEALPRQPETIEVLVVNDRRYSLRQLADAIGTSPTTLRRRVAQLDNVEE